ncbi:MAG: energy-coupling factor ABC transporter ATP-binding protein [Armatimonadota bacterium]
MSGDIIVDVSCLEHVYPGGIRVDICGIEFIVRRGQKIAVMGPNGAGKSTLLKHVLGLMKPTKGHIHVFGKDPSREYGEIRSKIGAVMQNVEEQLIGPTVFDDVAFAPLNFGFSKEDTYQRVESILHSLDIYHLRSRLPHYLSGGEKKKVALAGALVTGPELLILDEPLEGIDYASRQDITGFLTKLHKECGMTIISTLHNMEWVPDLADYGYLMKQGGRLELYGSIEELFFNHDLSQYNLAAPAVVSLIKRLHELGYDLKPTLDQENLVDQLISKFRHF